MTPVLGALVASVTYSTMALALDPPPANPSAVVLVLMDRSGSMVANVSCPDPLGGPASTIRRWDCGIQDAHQWTLDNDPGQTREYHYWELSTLAGAAMVTQQGPTNLTSVQTLLTTAVSPGPPVNDSATPLAGAFCKAVDFLKQLRIDKADPNLQLLIKLESDGLENATPVGDQCQGIDSGAGNPFVPPALPAVFTPATGPRQTVDGLLLPSWQSNMLDKAITGIAHTNVDDATAFVPPSAGAPVIVNTTFLQTFIGASFARILSPLDPNAPADVDVSPVAQARSSFTALAAATGPSTTENFLSFLTGLSEATGGRMVAMGSGSPLPPGDPGAIHIIPGDANDDSCVDLADHKLLSSVYGQTVSAANPDTFRADLSRDGVVSTADFLILKRDWGLGCAVSPGPTPPPLGNVVLGFEDLSNWTSAAALSLVTSPHTEGVYALRIGAGGTNHVVSAPFDTSVFHNLGTRVDLDVFVPASTGNQCTHGQITLKVSVPSAGIQNQSLGEVEFNTSDTGKFVTMQFHANSRVRRAMRESHPDFAFKISVESKDAGVILDNLRVP